MKNVTFAQIFGSSEPKAKPCVRRIPRILKPGHHAATATKPRIPTDKFNALFSN